MEHLPGKSLAYYDKWGAEDIEQAHELLDATIDEEESPFDGIIAYSQGASLAISYILQQQSLHPEKPPPFRFGVFFTPAFILSPDPDYKSAEVMSFLDKLDRSGLEMFDQALNPRNFRVSLEAEKFPGLEKLSHRERELCLGLWGNVEAMAQTRKVFQMEGEVVARQLNKKDFPRLFHPVYTAERVPFPTVHVTGSEEDRSTLHLANVAKGLCDGAVSLVNQGGHEIASKRETVIAIVRAIEKADFDGKMLGF